jgi:hypothetical protein
MQSTSSFFSWNIVIGIRDGRDLERLMGWESGKG